MSLMTDRIALIKDVLFVGDHFTMMTSVEVDETLRQPGEEDDAFYIRLASEGIREVYGWDVREKSNDVAIVE